MTRFLKRIAKRSLEKVADWMGIREQLTDVQKRLTDTQTQLVELNQLCHNIQILLEGAPDGLPIPPLRLRALTWPISADLRIYFRDDLNNAQYMLDMLTRHGIKTENLRAILDFGCGNGRAIRQFHSSIKTKVNAKFYGTDINREQIAWCKRNLSFAEFQVNGPNPPLSYGDEQFDFIYNFSVFTHFSEPQQLLWINELSRVLRPGGCLLLSTCGESYLHGLSEVEKTIYRSGQLVVRDAECAGIPSVYGNCHVVHPLAWVKEKMAKGFEVLEFVAGNYSKGGMDFYLLRKPTHAVVHTDCRIQPGPDSCVKNPL